MASRCCWATAMEPSSRRCLGTGANPLAYPQSIAVADLNGDGKLDLAVANEGYDSSTVSVLLGNGDGTFSTPRDFAAGNSPGSVVAGGFNGDDKLDLAVANLASGAFSVLPGNGDGTFQAPLETSPWTGA